LPAPRRALCDGIVSGDTVVCPLHGWKISLESGGVLKPDVCVRVETYPLTLDDGVISVQIESRKREEAA
jgi:nitrite reductase (NADH) small subunit